MKAKLYFILFLGMLFLHPGHLLASIARQGSSFCSSFQKVQLEKAIVSDDSQNLNIFFDADLDLDDDDDVSFSTRKKISFENVSSLNISQPSSRFCISLSDERRSYRYFYHLSSSHFISLSSLRL